MPVSGGDPTRGGEEVTAAAATLAAPAAPFNRGVAGNRRFMPATLVRASAVIVAAMAAACAACGGDARGVSSSEPLVVRIGTFLPKSGRSPLVDLAGVFSSEPLVAAAWDGRPVFRLAESLVESEDGRQLTVTLRSDIRFHTGDLITAPVVRDLLAKKVSALPEIAGLVALDDRRLQFSLHKASSVKPEDLQHDARRQQRTGTDRAAHRPLQARLHRADGVRTIRRLLPGETIGRADGDARVPDASCGVDGHDAAGSEFPPRGQPRRHRLRRRRRRHPRLPVAQALLHRAGLQHAPSGAEAPRGAGRHQRGARSQRARS